MNATKYLVASAVLAVSAAAVAAPVGSWNVGVGVAHVAPKSGTSPLANNTIRAGVDSNTQPSLTAEYMVAPNVGAEILLATPFKHDINLQADAARINAETKHLPPTVSVNYHFNDLHPTIKPYAGLGLNYTTFFSEKIAIPNAKLELKDSFGVAVQAGVDYNFTPTDAVRLNVRYIDIATDVKLNGNKIGTVDINPTVYGLAYVKTF